MKTQLQMNKIEGETEPTRRRRLAIAITDLLARDILLSEEVAALLDLDSNVLQWRVTRGLRSADLPKEDPRTSFVAL
jgi:hypothetical protein